MAQIKEHRIFTYLSAIVLALVVGFTNASCSSDDNDQELEYYAKRTELFDKLKTIAQNNPEGYTVDATTLQPITSGYAVAVADTQGSFGEQGLYNVIDYVMSHPEINAYGGWQDSETGDYYYDATMVFADRDEAIAFGLQNSQLAIFDLNTLTEIRLGGNQIKNLASERFSMRRKSISTLVLSTYPEQ